MNSVKSVAGHLRGHFPAYAALFIVLGGTAVALPARNTVDSGDIVKRAVKSSDLAKRAVKGKNIRAGAVKSAKIAERAVTSGKLTDGAATSAKIADGAVGAAKLSDAAVETGKLADEAVTGAKANEASFQGLVKGNGRLISNRITVPAHNGDFTTFPFPVILEIPGFGRAELITCNGDLTDGRLRVRMIAADGAAEFLSVGQSAVKDLPGGDLSPPDADSNAGFLENGGGGFLSGRGSTNPTIGVAGHFEFQLSRTGAAGATGATLEIDVYNTSSDSDPLGECHVSGQALIQE